MIPMFEVIAETRRGIILKIIFDQGDFGVDERSVMYGLETKDIRPLVGPNIGADVIRNDFAWLERLGLVQTTVISSGWSATITSRGQDVALGRERIPGLKRWVG